MHDHGGKVVRIRLPEARPLPRDGGLIRPCAAHPSPHGANCAACDIRSLTICAGISTDSLPSLSSIVHTVEMEPGQILFHEGDPANHVFNLTSGTLRLFKLLADGRRQITGFMLTGDFLGLASRDVYGHGAEAISEVKLCRFPVKEFRRLIGDHPDMNRRLLQVAADELAAAQEQMLLLGRKNPVERIASFLVSLVRRANRLGQPASPLHLGMSRADIADYLGLTIETVSRTFTKLKSRGVIGLPEPNRVEIPDFEALESLCDEG